MSIPYVPPAVDQASFNCPFCRAHAHFLWALLQAIVQRPGLGTVQEHLGHKAARCSACGKWSLWAASTGGDVTKLTNAAWKLVHPRLVSAPLANPDMPEDCRAIFEEARMIAADSPCAAAALLRLCVEKLCVSLKAKGDTLNQMIGDLVSRGLREDVQQALDIVRVTGDKSIHTGEIILGDDPEVAAALFDLVNEIVDEMISRPNKIGAIYQKLPPGAIEQIKRRDGDK